MLLDYIHRWIGSHVTWQQQVEALPRDTSQSTAVYLLTVGYVAVQMSCLSSVHSNAPPPTSDIRPVSQASTITRHSARQRASREWLLEWGGHFPLLMWPLVGPRSHRVGGDHDERETRHLWPGWGGPEWREELGVKVIKTHCILKNLFTF